MEGFVGLDYWHRAHEAFDALASWNRDGKITYHAEIVQGLRNAPSAMNRVFDGANKGKLVLEV